MLDGVFIFRESKNMNKTPVWSVFCMYSPDSKKRIKVCTGELSQPLGKEYFFTIGSPTRPKKVKPILTRRLFKYFYEHEGNQVFSTIFSW